MGKDWDRIGDVKRALRGKTSGLPTGPGSGRGTSPTAGRPGFDLSSDSQQRMQRWHEQWVREALRVLKPSGHLLAFGGTRTYHRLAAAMEAVGFEQIRLEAWGYGSGFPKSLNIGKAIDKQWGRLTASPDDILQRDVASPVVMLKMELRRLFDASGKSRKQIDEECGFRACNYLSYPTEGRRPDPWFYVLPSQEKWQVIKRVLGVEEFDGARRAQSSISLRLDELFKGAEREVIGYRKAIPGVAFSSEGPTEIPITIPATPEAALWEGWGTALKPAWEPVVVGRKP